MPPGAPALRRAVALVPLVAAQAPLGEWEDLVPLVAVALRKVVQGVRVFQAVALGLQAEPEVPVLREGRVLREEVVLQAALGGWGFQGETGD